MNNTTDNTPGVMVTVNGAAPVSMALGTLVRDLAPPRADDGLHHVGALVNNDAVSLAYPIEADSAVRMVTLRDPHGWRIYRSSVSFLLAKAVRDLFPEARFAVEHSLGTGFYCSFEMNGDTGITEENVRSLAARMKELVKEDVPIRRRKLAFADALQRFEREQQLDKYNLLRFRNPPYVVVYTCDGFTDLAHGPLADSTGALDHFELIPYEPGFVLQLSERENAPRIAPFEKQPHLVAIFREHMTWGKVMGIRTVGDLNAAVASGQAAELVRTAEAFHEKKITAIADDVARRKTVRWLFIAGPSSSGKTTFAKRLVVQLRVNGLRPVTISTDDYFVNREDTPRTEDGEYDFEHVETIDLVLFNDHLKQLDRGDEVEVPRFNFETGKREYSGKTMRISENQLVLVEGIHSLNPRLSEAIPAEHKYKIYISALTQLNLDNHNRVSTTDNRLIRRMIRDNQFRGNDGLTTLRMWPNVRQGEKKWIFPYQKEADAAFNSALDYELAVLRPFAERVLAEVKPYHAEYAEARRLMNFLSSFLVLSGDCVPPTSLLREFAGRSGFQY